MDFNFTSITKVAVVDDSVTCRQYLRELIGGTPGYAFVCACASAEEALVEIPKAQPDVVLVDIRLRGESGIACAARLREMLPELQVIMLTVYKDIKMIFQAFKAGACGYILKRADEKEILAAIADVRTDGAPMTSEIARMAIRSFVERPSTRIGRNSQLTSREMEILELLTEGLSNKEIGSRLGIGFGTVRTHLTHIYGKLHVRCRGEAATKYVRSNTKVKLSKSLKQKPTHE